MADDPCQSFIPRKEQLGQISLESLDLNHDLDGVSGP
jgi:hypothetical protein